MDEEMLAYQLRKAEESRPSDIQWLIIIALGVFLGNAASFGLEKAVFYWELQQVTTAATKVMEDTNRQMAINRQLNEAKQAEQRKILVEQERQRQIENEKRSAGYRQAKDTCDFWNQHLATENTVQNKMYRDQACSLVSQYR